MSHESFHEATRPIVFPDAPAGFRFGAVRAGIKPSGKPDFACVEATETATAAAAFTSNRLVAAPIIVGREHLRQSGGCGAFCGRQCGQRKLRYRRARHRGLPSCVRGRGKAVWLPRAGGISVFDRHHRRAAAGGKARRCNAKDCVRAGRNAGTRAGVCRSNPYHRHARKGRQRCVRDGWQAGADFRSLQGRRHDCAAAGSPRHHARVSVHRRQNRRRRSTEFSEYCHRADVQLHFHRRRHFDQRHGASAGERSQRRDCDCQPR